MLTNELQRVEYCSHPTIMVEQYLPRFSTLNTMAFLSAFIFEQKGTASLCDVHHWANAIREKNLYDSGFKQGYKGKRTECTVNLALAIFRDELRGKRMNVG